MNITSQVGFRARLLDFVPGGGETCSQPVGAANRPCIQRYGVLIVVGTYLAPLKEEKQYKRAKKIDA